MAKTISQNDLGFLGEEYQTLLVKAMIEDQDFFVSLYPILDQNMFTSSYLKRIVGFMKDYYAAKDVPPTYKVIELCIRTKVSNAVDVTTMIAIMTKMFEEKDYSAIDLVKEKSEQFFKQQNLIKAINQINDIIKKGSSERYPEAEEIIQRALQENTRNEFGFKLYENIEGDLQENYRRTIPTGADKLDEALSGGLGKGELGIIIAPMGVGKTSATTGFAAYAATQTCDENNHMGYKVLHFFFEDDEVNIRRKYYGYVTNIDACDLSLPHVRPKAVEILSDKNNRLNTLLRNNIYAERLSTGEVSASMIKQKIKKYIAAGFHPDLVIIDYFECLKPESGEDMINSSEWSKEGYTMRKLESTAKELGIAIWVPVQGTKDSIGLELVGNAQAGGSVKKTQIGHVVIGFAQTPDQTPNGRLNLTINKLRAARIKDTRFMNVKFNNGTCKFDFDDVGDAFMDNTDPIDIRSVNQLQNIANSTIMRS